MPNENQKTRIRAAKAVNEVGGMITVNNRPLVNMSDEIAFSPFDFRIPLSDIATPPRKVTASKAAEKVNDLPSAKSASLGEPNNSGPSVIKIGDRGVPQSCPEFAGPSGEGMKGWVKVPETRDSSAFWFRECDWVVRKRGKSQISPSASCRNTACDDFGAISKDPQSTRWIDADGRHFKEVCCNRCFIHYKTHQSAWRGSEDGPARKKLKSA